MQADEVSLFQSSIAIPLQLSTESYWVLLAKKKKILKIVEKSEVETSS